jgi:hypothetical protein
VLGVEESCGIGQITELFQVLHNHELSIEEIITIMFYCNRHRIKLLDEDMFKLQNTIRDAVSQTFSYNLNYVIFNFLLFSAGFRISHDDW